MAFEYNGKIYLNLEEQVEVNSKMAVDAKEAAEAAEALVESKADITYVDTELAKKVDKQTGIRSVYINNSADNVSLLPYTAAATENTIAYRSTGGVLSVGTPTSSNNAATKGYVDNGFIPKVAATGVVYTNNPSGVPSTISYTNSATGSTVVTRTTGGQVKCAAPVDGEAFHDDAAVNRTYGDGRYVQKASISTSRKIPYFSTTENGSYFTMTGGDGSTEPTSGGVVPVMTSGKISVATPTGDYHAATKKYVDDTTYATMSPSISTYTALDGLIWEDLYTAMSEGKKIYLLNPSSYLHVYSNDQYTTIANQSLDYVYDVEYANKYYFNIRFYKKNTGVMLHQLYQILPTGAISEALV